MICNICYIFIMSYNTKGTAVQGGVKRGAKWVLFFYSVPSRPVSNRMKVWRKLLKAGAVQLKGAVYILPFSDEHYEFLQWLLSEVTSMKGEGAIVSIVKVDTMEDAEVIALFGRQREEEYKTVVKALDGLERRLQSIRKGASFPDGRAFPATFGKIRKDFEEIQKIDFFASVTGRSLKARLERAKIDLSRLSGNEGRTERPSEVRPRSATAYHGKLWVTRKRPFVDRMASAWLIRRFIDADASFGFLDEKDIAAAPEGLVLFDIRGGEFTHTGDLCTFEALTRAFGIKDKAVRKIAEIIHELDIRDGKYSNAEAAGIEEILTGLRKAERDDAVLLEKGMSIFEMLYLSITA